MLGATLLCSLHRARYKMRTQIIKWNRNDALHLACARFVFPISLLIWFIYCGWNHARASAAILSLCILSSSSVRATHSIWLSVDVLSFTAMRSIAAYFLRCSVYHSSHLCLLCVWIFFVYKIQTHALSIRRSFILIAAIHVMHEVSTEKHKMRTKLDWKLKYAVAVAARSRKYLHENELLLVGARW